MYDGKFHMVMKLHVLFPSFFQKNEKWKTCTASTNIHWNNWRCVPCKMDLIMKWSISTCQFVTSLPTKISQQIPRNSPHRWWILWASIGSPVLIKVPWVDDFAGKNTGKWWWKAERIREVRCLFLVEMVCSTLQWKTEYECIYIYIRFKVERCFFSNITCYLVSRVRVMAFLVWQLWFHPKMFSIVF